MAANEPLDAMLDDDRTRIDEDRTRVIPDNPDRTVVASARPVVAGGVDPDATVLQAPPAVPVQPAAAQSAVASAAPQPAMPAAAAPAAPAVLDRSALIGLPPLPKGTQNLALPAGFRLHEYRIDGVLGQGGFGITYVATDVHLNTRVAIKEYLPAEIAFRTSDKTVSVAATRHRELYQFGLDSFLVEARTLATFRHPNIVRVARFFEAHQTAYMVLEYERGSPLSDWWTRRSDHSEKELLMLLQPLLDGLSVVHAAGFLHRDIKPDNIQVRRHDNSLVLLDFGSSRQAAATAEQAQVVLTPGYAPIEQYRNQQQGAWTDIYALGATLYWLVTGRKPPGADTRQKGFDPLVPASKAAAGRYSASFLEAIDWALRTEPSERPQDLDEWRVKLYASHAASMGLQEALMAESGEGTGRLMRASARRWWSGAAAALRRMVQPAAWPFAVKMTVAMVLTALLPMLSVATYNLSGSREAIVASELYNLEQLARSTAGQVAQLIRDSRNLARIMGTDVDFVRFLSRPDAAGRQEIQAKLTALVKANPDIHLVMVMDAQGVATVSSDPEVMGRNFAFREYFKAAMQGREHVTGMVVGAVAGAAGMFYAQPVFHPEPLPGQAPHVIGAVVLRIRASSFASILEDVQTDPALTPFLVDGDGVLIHHPDARLLYSSLMPLPPQRLQAIRADQRFRRDNVNSLDLPELAGAMLGAVGPGHVSYTSPVSGEDEIAGFAPVQGHDWVVGVSESREVFEAPIMTLYEHLLWSVGLLGLLFTGLALRFARSVVRPVRALTAGADALKRGDYDAASVSVRSRDEIGQLARTFNVMIDVLRQRERERSPRAPHASSRKPR